MSALNNFLNWSSRLQISRSKQLIFKGGQLRLCEYSTEKNLKDVSESGKPAVRRQRKGKTSSGGIGRLRTRQKEQTNPKDGEFRDPRERFALSEAFRTDEDNNWEEWMNKKYIPIPVHDFKVTAASEDKSSSVLSSTGLVKHKPSSDDVWNRRQVSHYQSSSKLTSSENRYGDKRYDDPIMRRRNRFSNGDSLHSNVHLVNDGLFDDSPYDLNKTDNPQPFEKRIDYKKESKPAKTKSVHGSSSRTGKFYDATKIKHKRQQQDPFEAWGARREKEYDEIKFKNQRQDLFEAWGARREKEYDEIKFKNQRQDLFEAWGARREKEYDEIKFKDQRQDPFEAWGARREKEYDEIKFKDQRQDPFEAWGGRNMSHKQNQFGNKEDDGQLSADDDIDDYDEKNSLNWKKMNHIYKRSRDTREVKFWKSQIHTDRKLPKILSEGREILYGIHPSIMALKGKKRLIHRAYIKRGPNESRVTKEIIPLIKKMNVKMEMVAASSLLELSGSRPHQGVCLEVDPLEISMLDLENFSALDTNKPELWFLPLQVKDPMNLGGLLRTCHFLGVSKVLLSDKFSCKPSPVVSKASSGAMEIMDLAMIKNLTQLLELCQLQEKLFHTLKTDSKNKTWRWQTCGDCLLNELKQLWKENGGKVVGTSSHKHHISPVEAHSYTATKPTLLIAGGEMKGIRNEVLDACDDLVTISSGHNRHLDIDSLNVSVASGIVLYNFMVNKSLFTQQASKNPTTIIETSNVTIKDLHESCYNDVDTESYEEPNELVYNEIKPSEDSRQSSAEINSSVNGTKLSESVVSSEDV